QRNDSFRNSFTVRLWRTESISRDEAKRKIEATGVDPKTADEILRENEGLLRNTTPVKLYKSGMIDRKAAGEQLGKLGVKEETYKIWLDNADYSRKRTNQTDL